MPQTLTLGPAGFGMAFAGAVTPQYRVFQTGNATPVTDWTTAGVAEVGGSGLSGAFYVEWTVPSGFTAGRWEFRDANPPTVEVLGDVIKASDVQAAVGLGNGRTIAEALAFLRNRWTLTGSVLTVYASDDASILWQAVVGTDASAAPVTGSDPA